MNSSQADRPFKNISDTARFVALLRAMESERPDAHFHDPFARRFAGAQSHALLRFLRKNRRFDARHMAVRTQVIDETITQLVAENGVDTVLNLAAGLDTRPYRMNLPASLRWIEVDLPGLLTEKSQVLKEENPRCQLEVIPMNLTDRTARRELFTRINEGSGKVLILTEGLLMYLREEEVKSLASDLKAQSHFAYWIMDLLSPDEVRWIVKKYGDLFSKANTGVFFGPEEGPDFFRRQGWIPRRFFSFLTEAHRLNRETCPGKLLRWVAPLAPAKWMARRQRFYGIAWLERGDNAGHPATPKVD